MLVLVAMANLLAGAFAAERPPPGGSHGTAINLGRAWEAVHKATQEKKLLLLVHISGMFEDPTFT
jgi:hypothetical protein